MLARSAREILRSISQITVLLALAVTGCAAAHDGAYATSTATPWAGRSADLFDDTIEPAAVGLDFDKDYAPRMDKALRERAQVGDAVLRVRVSTITAQKDGLETTYHLGLRTLEQLAGRRPPPVDFTVRITKASESYGIVKSFESRMVGHSFIAFVREFVQTGGDRELHFHLAPDSKEVRAAVNEAVIMGALR